MNSCAEQSSAAGGFGEQRSGCQGKIHSRKASSNARGTGIATANKPCVVVGFGTNLKGATQDFMNRINRCSSQAGAANAPVSCPRADLAPRWSRAVGATF